MISTVYKNSLRKLLIEVSYKCNQVLRRSSSTTDKEYTSIIGRTANKTYDKLDSYSVSDIYME